MAKLSDSAHVNRLIKLLMMLPPPGNEEYPYFWDKVAEEHRVSRGYVTQKISAHIKLILDRKEGGANRGKQLAHYALFFFGHASEELTKAITYRISVGAPNSSAGEVWVQELRATAFAVIEESFPDDRLHDGAVAAWVRRFYDSED